MEERIEKNDGLTVESLQAQVDDLKKQLEEANKYRQMYSELWCEDRGRVERYREVYKALLTMWNNVTITVEVIESLRKIFTNMTIREA